MTKTTRRTTVGTLKHVVKRLAETIWASKADDPPGGITGPAMFHDELERIETLILDTPDDDLPALFSRVPLELFGHLLLGVPERFPALQSRLPVMPADEIQISWTGQAGPRLLEASVVFVRTMLQMYGEFGHKSIRESRVLDFGCGWGRLLRLMNKYVPSCKLYGVDPWDESLALCRHSGIRAQLARSDYLPRSLPFDDKFDLVFAFSVFTHLSERAMAHALEAIRDRTAAGGVLVLTIRPREVWHFLEGGRLADAMGQQHQNRGFAYRPHDREPVDGDVTYGDTSMSLEYIEKNFPRWRLTAVERNAIDPYQIVVCLLPA